MKKIEKFLKENINKLLIGYLFIQPIIDLVTSLCLNVLNIDITIGMIIRFLFLGILLFYFIFFSKSENKKKTFIYLALVFAYIVGFIIQIILLKDTSVLFYELSNLIRCFYFPISLILLINLSENNNINIKIDTWKNLFLIYILLIFIPTIFNIGFNGYTQGKVGSIGWFNSSNEISAILSILLPLFIYGLNKMKLVLKLVISLITLYVVFNLGSKIIILSLGLIIMYYGFIYIKKLIKENKKKQLGIVLVTLILIITLGIMIIPKTNFYKNIKLHLDFLEVDSITEVLTNYKVFDHFIFSSRLTFLENTASNYLESNISEKLLGIGYIENYASDDVNLKMIEIDPFDIFFRHGLIGFIIYFLPFIISLIVIIKNYRKEKNNEKLQLLFSIILSIILMNLSGHVLTSPAVSIYLSIIMVLLIQKEKTKKVK